MLTMRVGHDTDYLTDAVAKGRDSYYTGASAAGEPPGRWYGAGAELLGLTGDVDADVMKALYTHGLDPRDPATADRASWHQAARLGNAPRNYKKADEIYAGMLDAHPDATPEERAEMRTQAARSARQSVAFYDVVLSAPKSMTLMWVGSERAASDAHAAGDEAGAAEWAACAADVEEALMVGHRAVLDFLAEKAGYARAGRHGGGGGQWVDAHQLIAAQFLQHDSREHDPQLHVHGPVANKVPVGDGKWLAIDGNLITQWKAAAAAIGERTAEAYLAEKRGAWWQTRPDGQAREIAGVDTESSGVFSKRTAAITPTLDGLIGQFRAEMGRAPTASEQSQLHEKAFLMTRAGKVFGEESREGQIARWAAEHAEKIGVQLGDVARSVLDHPAGEPDTWSERDVVARALAAMEESKQSWTRSELMFAVGQALPGHLGIGHQHITGLLEGLTDKAEALARHLNPRTGPEGLDAKYYRADGTSVFVKPHAQRFATDTQLLGEAELRAAAVRRGAAAWTSEEAQEVIDRFARSGRVLGVDQAAALRGILTSGAAVEVLAAPAGTGKSFLVGTLAESWPLTGRPGATLGDAPGPAPGPGGAPGAGEGSRVFGLAFGQAQAEVLSEEGVTASNIRRWLDGQQRLDAGTAAVADEAFRLRSGDLVVVDEAGAAPTADLVAIHRCAEQAGAKLLLVGDSRQLAAVGAGGALADIAERGITYELAEVRRFRDDWEGPASLRLRDGDTSVVAEYVKHGRLVDAGTVEQAEAAASRAWLADTLAGRDALLLVGSNDAAARVCAGLRADLVRLGRVQEAGVKLGMQGTIAGVGDLVQARRNAWHLDGWAGNTEAPINRTTYRVTALRADGGLTVARVTGRDTDGAEQLADPLQLPASYVSERVALAYASTVHGAVGRTVDAGYPVLGPGTDAASGYVQLTRGRETNVAFVVTRRVAEDADTGETHKVPQRSPAEIVADVIRPPDIERDRTALTEAETAADHARATATHVDPLIEVIADTIAGRTGSWLDRLAADDSLPERHRIALAADEARTTLDQLLRAVELAGHDPDQVLTDAVTSGSLDKSTSVAQVLHFRIRTTLDGKLAPQVATYADLLPRDLPDEARAGLEALAAAADTRRTELGAELATEPTPWAREALGPVPADAAGRAQWEHKAGWAASYRELVDHTDDTDPLGAAPPAGLSEKHAVFRTAHAVLDLPDAGADEEAMSEGRLRARVAAWDRERACAPRYVADELDATHEALRKHQTDAAVWAARADAEPDPLQADQLRTAAEQARRQAEQLAPVIADLEFADTARALWWIETAVSRDNAERSRAAAGLRGIDLDTSADQVTAEEWLDAHEADKLAADADRVITEHDLPDLHDLHDAETETDIDEQGHTPEPTERPGPADEPDRADDVGRDDPAVVDDRTPDMDSAEVQIVNEPAPDIRDVVVPDAGERVDPEHRRRVPLLDETTATVERANLAVTEIRARRAAEAAEHARAAQAEPDDDRREDLNRWSDTDQPADDATRGSACVDEEDVLER